MNALNIARNDFSEIELAAIPYNILGEHYGDKQTFDKNLIHKTPNFRG